MSVLSEQYCQDLISASHALSKEESGKHLQQLNNDWGLSINDFICAAKIDALLPATE